jgi:hypothetical protein
MRAYIVVEEEADRILLARLIAEDLAPSVTIAVAGGKSSAVSLCASLLARRQAPTALVIDSNTTDEADIGEQSLILDDMIRPAAGSAPYLVQLAVPELESVLFTDPDAFGASIGTKLSAADLLTAKYSPTDALRGLMRETGKPGVIHLVARLNDSAVAGMRRSPLATSLDRFLRAALTGTGARSNSEAAPREDLMEDAHG